jgi:Skp family chaperone for outer membrane proteins
LVQRIRETTAEVARERGVAIVLEARHVLAGRGLVDLSDAVLERLVPRPAR